MMIPVSKPLLPDPADYAKELNDIWSSSILTNHGPKAQELERALSLYLGIPSLELVANGTLALHIALKAVSRSKKVLTTPFSFIATTSSIVWEGMEPVFVDIKPQDFTIDEDLVEQALKKDDSIKTILATHVYGFACNVDRLEELGKRYGVKVIYDAAHAFGVTYDGRSLLTYGDISTLSFHATKVFHTGEGGAVFSKSSETMEKIHLLRNFGFLTPETFAGVGMNAKMSELHAAMGLCLLKIVDGAIEKRRKLSMLYGEILSRNSPELTQPQPMMACSRNYAYFPILCKSETQLERIRTKMEKLSVTTRRYFYPSLNTLSYVTPSSCPISEDTSKRILCLPLYADLEPSQVEWIATEVAKVACE